MGCLGVKDKQVSVLYCPLKVLLPRKYILYIYVGYVTVTRLRLYTAHGMYTLFHTVQLALQASARYVVVLAGNGVESNTRSTAIRCVGIRVAKDTH